MKGERLTTTWSKPDMRFRHLLTILVASVIYSLDDLKGTNYTQGNFNVCQ
jgi:hypothetical protein